MKKILDVKTFQETLHKSMCGPASLKIVLAYFVLEKTEKEEKYIKSNELITRQIIAIYR